MVWGTSKTLHLRWRSKVRNVCNLTVDSAQSRLKMSGQSFKSLFYSLVLPIATFMSFPSGEDTEVDYLTSKMTTLFHMNLSALEYEIFSLQADIQLKSRASSG